MIGTAVLRQTWSFKLPDAIHIVSALYAGGTFFMSDDEHMRQMPHGLRRISPDDAGVAAIRDALRG
jgi:hypothetical protein